MLAAIADFERDLIRERTGEGRKSAMANGVKFARKRKLSDKGAPTISASPMRFIHAWREFGCPS